MSNESDNESKPRFSRTGKPLGDYAVGYGRPPLGTRFSSTNNPGGRRKGSKNIRTLLREKLDDKLRVKKGDRDRKMSKREIGAEKFINRFVENPDLKTILAIDRMENPVGAAAQAAASSPPTESDTLADAERRKAMLAWYLSRAPRAPDRGEDDADNEITASDASAEGGDDDR